MSLPGFTNGAFGRRPDGEHEVVRTRSRTTPQKSDHYTAITSENCLPANTSEDYLPASTSEHCLTASAGEYHVNNFHDFSPTASN
jgi:hypothetical protein